MDRKGAYMKPGAGVSAPLVVITCAVETNETHPRANARITDHSFKRAFITVRSRRRGKWGQLHEYDTCDARQAISLINQLGYEHRTNWVVCPVASEVLTLIGWWKYAEEKGVIWKAGRANGSKTSAVGVQNAMVVLSALVARGSPDIVIYNDGGKTFKWVSITQYYPDGLSNTNKRIDHVVSHLPPDSPDRAPVKTDRRSEALETSLAFQKLCDWWLTVAKVPFGSTAGQLAVGLLRSHITPRTLCSHNHSDAHSLERQAAFGGRASVWYVGNIGRGDGRENVSEDFDGTRHERQTAGPVHHFDVRSMYAHLLATQRFPVKLLHDRSFIEPRALYDLAGSAGVIAQVTIDVHRPEYPHRRGNKVWYPVGRFTTVLTGPEILEIPNDGEIVSVGCAYSYTMGKPFASFAEEMLGQRYAARARGDVDHEKFSKLMANSLPGKLAQRKGHWERKQSRDEPGRWGESFEVNIDTGKIVKTKYILGACWQWNDEPSGAGPYTFAFAYLAAYGRLQMRRIRAVCPPDTIVSQDTDGIWVLNSARDSLTAVRGLVGEEPGQLHIKGSASNARFYSPKNYFADGRWIMAGFHQPDIPVHGMTIADTHRTSLWSSRTDRPPTTTTTFERSSLLKCELDGGTADVFGWVRPCRIIPGRA